MTTITLDVETSGLDWQKDQIHLLGYRIDGGDISYDEQALMPILNDTSNILRGHNCKFDALFLQANGYAINCKLEDTRVLAYLEWPEIDDHSLKSLVREKLKGSPKELTDLLFKPLKRDLLYINPDEYFTIDEKLVRKDLLTEYHKEDILNVDRLRAIMHPTDWFFNVEMPLTKILFEMELHGCPLDISYLSMLQYELSQKTKVLFERIGMEKPNSSAQVIEKFKAKGYNLDELCEKTPEGKYCVDKAFLKDLTFKGDQLAVDLLEYRRLTKILGTYIEPYIQGSTSDGKIHGSFNQAGSEDQYGDGKSGTKTGRLSACNPNLENVPARTEIGKKVRKAFIPSEGCKMYDADLKQIQPRLIGHYSQSPKLIKAYNEHLDTHGLFACDIFNKAKIEDITGTERFIGKTSWLATVFGCSPYKLLTICENFSDKPLELDLKPFEKSYNLLPPNHSGSRKCFRGCRSCLVKELGDLAEITYTKWEYFRNVQESFKRTNPEIMGWRQTHIDRTRRLGYLITIGGRIIRIPNLNSDNRRERMAAEREAVNFIIQGSEADLVKQATLSVRDLLKAKEGKCLAIIHDEWLFQSKQEIKKEEFEEAVRKTVKLRNIPIDIDFHPVKSWADKP